MTSDITVRASDQGVAITLPLAQNPRAEIVLTTEVAVRLAREILAVAGERDSLPSSRQIGGIIGPY